MGSFTRAAEGLHLAQPSLSRQITTLERDLGVELFHRSRTGNVLTFAGEALLPMARRMLADEESIRRELNEIAGLRRGRVRLGATPTLCISLVAEVLGAFRSTHPAVELHLSEHGSRRLLDELAGGELDLAIITSSDDLSTESFEISPLLVEELVVISSSNAPPVTQRRTMDLTEVSRLPQIVFSSAYDLRRATDAAFASEGLVPAVVVEGAEMDAVLRFVERGLGVAIVPSIVLIGRPGLRSVRLAHDALTRTISVARPAELNATPAVRVMKATIATIARQLARDNGATIRLVDSSESAASSSSATAEPFGFASAAAT